MNAMPTKAVCTAALVVLIVAFASAVWTDDMCLKASSSKKDKTSVQEKGMEKNADQIGVDQNTLNTKPVDYVINCKIKPPRVTKCTATLHERDGDQDKKKMEMTFPKEDKKTTPPEEVSSDQFTTHNGKFSCKLTCRATKQLLLDCTEV